MEALGPRTHRRSRSRKKKPAETVESIVPGRASVAIVTTEPSLMDSDICVKDDNDYDDCDEVGQRSSVAGYKLVAAATTTFTAIGNNDTCLSSNVVGQTALTTTAAKRIPVPICYAEQPTKQADDNNPSSTTPPLEAIPPTRTTSPSASITGGSPTVCLPSSAFTVPRPNIAIRSRSSAAEIQGPDKGVSQPMRLNSCNSENTLRDSSFCQSHFRTARSRKSSAELDDIDNLPSSRPFSLDSFAVRTHNRNKGSKSWIPFSLDDLDEVSNEMDPHNQNRVIRQPARFLAPSATGGNHSLRNVTTIDPRPSVFGFHGTSPLRAPQWQQAIRQRPHPGHMETIGYYQQNLGTNNPRQDLRPAAVPHTIVATPGTGPRMMVPDDISPTKHEEKQALRALQYNMVGQSYLQTGHCLPGLTCNIINQAHNISSTNAGTGGGYCEGATGLRTTSSYGQTTGHVEQNYSLQYPPIIQDGGNVHYSVYGPGQIQSSWTPVTFSETGIPGATAETFHDPEKSVSTSLLTRPPVFLKQPASQQTNINISPQPVDSDQSSHEKLHDIARYLKNVITASQNASESNTGEDFHVGVKEIVAKINPIPLLANPLKSPHKSLQQDTSPTKSARTPQVQRTPKNGQTQGNLPDSNSTSTSMPLTYTSSNGLTKVSPVFASALASRPESYEIISKPANSPQSRFKFPPPGLPIPPSLQGVSTDKPYIGEETPTSSLVQSNIWFHTDKRGEDIFRLRITEIARGETRCQKTLKVPLRPREREGVAEAGTVLLGHVLANLQSYTLSDSNQAKGFANFALAPKHCYEPTHVGCRSFLDLDPMTDVWKLPSPRHPLSKDPIVAYGEGGGTDKEVGDGKGP